MTRSSGRIRAKGKSNEDEAVEATCSNPPIKRSRGRPKRPIEDSKIVESKVKSDDHKEDESVEIEENESPSKKLKQMIKEDITNEIKAESLDNSVKNKKNIKGKRPVQKTVGKRKDVKKEIVDDEDGKISMDAAKTDDLQNKIANGNDVKDEPINGDASTDHDTKPSKESGKKSKVSKAKKEKPEKIVKPAVERPMIKKGPAAVDGFCPIAHTARVFFEGEDIWDCMLNQTNIQFNNNKFYLIQLLKDDSKDVYSVWMRWARVGATGQNSLIPCGSNLDKAKQVFCKKFNDKTKNDWDERDCFEKVPGKYDLLKMDYSDSKDEVDAKISEVDIKAPIQKVESKLEIRVRALIELICDVKAMEEAVVEMKYDANKAPLGKLTVKQVKAGYAALKAIDDCIRGSGKSDKNLLYACNDFYTRIPHHFGMRVPPLIRTKAEVLEKMNLLQALGDIQAAMSVIGQKIDVTMHPSDQHYKGLGCQIEAIEKEDKRYKLLSDYLLSTHGKTHSMYTLEVLEIYKVERQIENERFKDFGNNTLLWHGSRLTNWAGILNQGLRIAPPEAPCTGYMFGKGLYFADMSSKSANYCMTTRLKNVGLLTLCTVSLGWAPKELLNADMNADKLRKGSYSVKALGKIAPDSRNSTSLSDSDGTIVPMGPGIETNIENARGYTLQYNEYIVYDPAQVKMQFLFKVKFHYK